MLTVYGIPTCGTVRKARKWLDDRDLTHEWVDLRLAPPSRERIDRWIAVLGSRAMRNTSGGAYRALGPEKETYGDAEWAEAFASDPMLIKRPVVERDGEPVLVGFRGSDDELASRLG